MLVLFSYLAPAEVLLTSYSERSHLQGVLADASQTKHGHLVLALVGSVQMSGLPGGSWGL